MTENSTQSLQCPMCKADIEAVGVFEVKTNVLEWTHWKKYGERWDIRDTESDASDGNGWLECGRCQKRLPDALETQLWKMMNS